MKYLIRPIFIILVLCSSYSEACRYRAQTLEERFENASYVYTAWVTGVHLTEFETHRINEMKDNPEELFQVIGYELKLFSLLSIEKFKGSRTPPKNVYGGQCGSGFLELKDKAIFFVSKDQDGDYNSYAISESNDKEYFLKSLEKVRKLSK